MCVRCGTGSIAWCTSPDRHAREEVSDMAVTLEMLSGTLAGLRDHLATSDLSEAADKQRARSLAHSVRELAAELAMRGERVWSAAEGATS